MHDFKLLLQQHFGDGLVVVVGSGLSCAEGLPGMSAIADELKASLAGMLTGPDTTNWANIAANLADGLEAALLKVAPSPSVESAIAETIIKFVAPIERTILEEVFSGKRMLAFSRLLRHLLKPAEGIPVITTNYDRLIEVAVEEIGLGVDTMFVGNFAGELNEIESRLSFCREVVLKGKHVQRRFRDRVNLYKPHGSLDWYFRSGRPVRSAVDLSLPRLIITPGLNKFRNGYESPFDRHRERANTAIDRASRILIIGYGFNDDHLETHLAPKIRSGTPTLILARSLSGNANKLVSASANVIALQCDRSNDSQTIAIANGVTFTLPNVRLWDLNHFVTEVLEP